MTFATLPAEDQQRLLNKLAKLKALSECKTGNVNETATAAATMTRLMMEYEIEIADLESPPTAEVADEELTGEARGCGYPTWQTQLLSALAQANNCISYTSSRRERNMFWISTENRLRLIGAPQDIQNTRKLFVYCVQEIERLCKQWARRGASTAEKNDFRKGAAYGIAAKVDRERQEVIREEQARAEAKGVASRGLAVFDSRLAAAQEKAREIGLRFTRSYSRGVSKEAFEDGFRAGANVDFNTTPKEAIPQPKAAD